MRTRARGSGCCSAASGTAPRTRSRSWWPSATLRRRAVGARRATAASPAVAPAERSRGHVLLTAVPDAGTDRAELRATIDRLRGELPAGALLGGAAAETRDLERALVSRLPLVVGVVLGLGFVLLLALLRAPLAAAAAVALSLLATVAAFGVARLVFQEGALDQLLGLRVAGLRRRVGADLLLRARLRAGDGLHACSCWPRSRRSTTARATPAMRSSRAWPARGA